ncbi:MAG TPA: TIR domain-containing protein [Ktedonobacteraceae bacterium]|nr:TIR domain-containing protein [Ktedonobacteraceae bacterium]
MSEQEQEALATGIFYCYARCDEIYRQELEKHLSILRHQGIIREWHDREIVPGTNWAEEIDIHLSTASVILLLISSDFLTSNYCYGIEMKKALEMHKTGEACVIPILLRPVVWQGAPFAHLQCLPRDARAVTLWQNRDAAFSDIVEGIHTVIIKHSTFFSSSPASSLLPPQEQPLSIIHQDSFEDAILSLEDVDIYGEEYKRLTRLRNYNDALALCNHVLSLNLDELGIIEKQRTISIFWCNKGQIWHLMATELEDRFRYKELEIFRKKIIDECESACSLQPDLGVLWSLKGEMLMFSKRYKEALGAHEHALALYQEELLFYPELARGIQVSIAEEWRRKGDCLYLLDRYKEALVAYEECLKLDPENPRGLYGKKKVIVAVRGWPKNTDKKTEADETLTK